MARRTASGQLFTELVIEIFRLNGLLLAAGDTLTEPVGLTSARWQVLGVVEHGPAPVPNIARAMGLSRQAVQQTADALAREGFVAYRDNPHHRRAKLVVLTDHGRRALDQVAAQQAVWADAVARTAPATELELTLRTLRRLREHLAG